MRRGESNKEELWTTRQRNTFTATSNNKAWHGTAILIHKRWTKLIKEVQHSGPRHRVPSFEKKTKFRLQVSPVYFPYTGYGDEHVQQVYSEIQKHTDRYRKTNTHMVIGGDFNEQVGSNDKKKSTRLQIHQKTRIRRAIQQRPVAQAPSSPTPTDTGQHVLLKARQQQSHEQLNQTLQAT